MNLAAELFLTAFGTIMGIVIVFSVIARLISNEDKGEE
ncbi:hypothetical protein VINE108521_12065 [Vibrio neonatus]